MKKSLYIIVVGCGRLGSQLANDLSKLGHSVVVVDRDENSFIKLSVDFSGFMIEGDATQIKVLEQAKTEKADVFIAATSDDNINLLVSQTADKIYKVKLVLTRIFDLKKEKIFAILNIKAICPTSLSLDYFLKSVDAVSKNE